MEKKELLPGAVINTDSQQLQGLMLILEGTVRGDYPGGEILLKKADVIGLSEVYSGVHFMVYTVIEKATVIYYPYRDGELISLLKERTETVGYFAASVFRQFQEFYNQYRKGTADSIYLYRYYTKNYARYEKLCEKYQVSPRALPAQEGIAPLEIEKDIEPWLGGYYHGLQELLNDRDKTERMSSAFYSGLIWEVSRSIYQIITLNNTITAYRSSLLELFMNESGLDLFDLFTSTYFRVYYLAVQEKPEALFIEETINLLIAHGFEKRDFFNTRVREYRNKFSETATEEAEPGQHEKDSHDKAAAFKDSLEVILEYAACPAEIADKFRQELKEYKRTANKSGVEENDRLRRITLSRLFYQIYGAALQVSLQETPPVRVEGSDHTEIENIPRILRMFFQFGYVDEELAGLENAVYLYDIVDHLPTDPQNRVYTIYEWLKAIYEGRKEPSRNEFDTDYTDYINSLKKSKKITAAQEAEMLADQLQKVMFELEHVFPVFNKITFGRISIFCPVLSEHNVLKPLDKMLVSADMIQQVFDQIRGKDFGAFCRESLYSQPDKGVVKEYINTEVQPDVILTPNIGTRGIMWQEIEGKRRGTPARFVCSLFQAENLQHMLIRLTGEFRWEMCKRIQGARWNDASERSLTSDYSEYLQSYRKNLDLSSDVKEKIKSDLSKLKNNTKEMFVYDYMNWILYESGGSPRLNKVARTIFFTYCPFTAQVREKLRTNPLYADVLDKYDLRLKQRLRSLDILYQKLHGSSLPVPEEIAETRRILEL